MDFLSSLSNIRATDQECEYISNNILEFCTYMILDENRANWKNWLCNTLEYLILTYPDKIEKYIPHLHRIAVRVGKMKNSSNLFSFFLGYYLVTGEEYKTFLSFTKISEEENHQCEIVNRLKRVEYLWDVIEHIQDDIKDDNFYRILQNLFPLEGDVDITHANLCQEIYLETKRFYEDGNILIDFHARRIDLHEYNLFRLLHLHNSIVNAHYETCFNSIVESIKSHGHDVRNLLHNMKPVFSYERDTVSKIIR
jgi:CRISPR/Cas system CSM-associated protein Csm2 small subunit